MWQPSPSEADGDPYYAIASDAGSALYDPNYRQFDVEGYRIYRGRVDNPDELSLIAQFDYAGTIFDDYDGVVNPVDTCAPELDIFDDCPVDFDSVAPGVARTVSNPNNIVSPFISTKFGDSPRTGHRTGHHHLLGHGGHRERVGHSAADQLRRAVRLRGQRGPEQLPVLLRGHGLRRELLVLRSHQPRIAEVGHAVGHSAGPGVEPGATGTVTPGMFGGRARRAAQHHQPGLVFPKTPGMNRTAPSPVRSRRRRSTSASSASSGRWSANPGPRGPVGQHGHGQRGPVRLLRRRRPHPGVYYFSSIGSGGDFQLASAAYPGPRRSASTEVYFAVGYRPDLAAMYGGDSTFGPQRTLSRRCPARFRVATAGAASCRSPGSPPRTCRRASPAPTTTVSAGSTARRRRTTRSGPIRPPAPATGGVTITACAANGTTGGFNNAGELPG